MLGHKHAGAKTLTVLYNFLKNLMVFPAMPVLLTFLMRAGEQWQVMLPVPWHQAREERLILLALIIFFIMTHPQFF